MQFHYYIQATSTACSSLCSKIFIYHLHKSKKHPKTTQAPNRSLHITSRRNNDDNERTVKESDTKVSVFSQTCNSMIQSVTTEKTLPYCLQTTSLNPKDAAAICDTECKRAKLAMHSEWEGKGGILSLCPVNLGDTSWSVAHVDSCMQKAADVAALWCSMSSDWLDSCISPFGKSS